MRVFKRVIVSLSILSLVSCGSPGNPVSNGNRNTVARVVQPTTNSHLSSEPVPEMLNINANGASVEKPTFPENANAPGTVAKNPLPPAGIFWRTVPASDIARYGAEPFLAGGRSPLFSWCELEPKPDEYDFRIVRDYILAWAALDKPVTVGISVASSAEGKNCDVFPGNSDITSASPGWIFTDPNYQAAFIDAGQKQADDPILRSYWPVYWDAVFRVRYLKLVTALVADLEEKDLLKHVAWFEMLNGREGSTSLARDDFYQDYVAFFKNNNGVDFNFDGTIDELDLEYYWTQMIKQNILDLDAIFSPAGARGIVPLGDFQIPLPKKYNRDRYYINLKEIAEFAVSKGWVLGAKVLDIDAKKMAQKPATRIFNELPDAPKALWNDFNSFGKNHDIRDFKTNYEHAIGGGDTGIPLTYVNWVFLAPSDEVEGIVTQKLPTQSCPESPVKPGKCWKEMPLCSSLDNEALCWPPLRQILDQLQGKLKAVVAP